MKSSSNLMQIMAIFSVLLILNNIGPPATVWAWRSFKLVFTSFPLQFNTDIVDVKSELQNSAGESTLSLSLHFLEDVNDVLLHITIALESTEVFGNFTIITNRSMNFCKFLKQRNTEPMLRVFYEDILKNSNWVKECPIKKGSYHLHEYHMDEELLPSYVPETNFYIDLNLTNAMGKLLFNGRLNGKIDKSKGFDNLKMFSLG